MTKPDVRYRLWDDFPGWERAPQLLADLIDREDASSVLEIGGGREPTLSVEDVTRRGIRFTVNDVDADELALADPAYTKLCCDMSGELDGSLRTQQFDLIFSRMVNEHVADGRRYHTNLYDLLRPGGLSVHLFATLWSVPFVLNRLIPEAVADRLLAIAQAKKPDRHEKFPARYSWCRGPTPTVLARLGAIGYEVETYEGFFGHGYYIRLTPLHRLEQAKSRWLHRHPRPAMTSYAMMALRKPADAGA